MNSKSKMNFDKWCGSFRNLILAAAIFLCGPVSLQAGAPVFVTPPDMETARSGILSRDDLIFHKLDHKDYNESWFFQCHLDDGSILFVNLSVTNAGLRKWDSSMDLWLRLEERVITSHSEVPAGRLAFDAGVPEIRIGGTRFSGSPPIFSLSFDEKDLAGSLIIDLAGKGRPIPADLTYFDAERTRFSAFTILALGAEVKGRLRNKGSEVDISGTAYVNHHLATILPPQYCSTWYSFVAFHQDLIFYVAFKDLTDAFTGGPWKYLAVIRDGRLALLTHDFELKAGGFRVHERSGRQYMTECTIRAGGHGEGCTLSGRFELDEDFLWLDVFRHLGSVTRWLVKTFYTKAWNQRCSYKYELTFEPAGGPAINVSGLAVADNTFFE